MYLWRTWRSSRLEVPFLVTNGPGQAPDKQGEAHDGLERCHVVDQVARENLVTGNGRYWSNHMDISERDRTLIT